ncbi:unnamed protein product [Leuciscus chuanchicus]
MTMLRVAQDASPQMETRKSFCEIKTRGAPPGDSVSMEGYEVHYIPAGSYHLIRTEKNGSERGFGYKRMPFLSTALKTCQGFQHTGSIIRPEQDVSAGNVNLSSNQADIINTQQHLLPMGTGLSQSTNKGQTVAGKRRLVASCSALSRLLSSVPMKSDTMAMQVKRSEEVKRRATHWPLQTTSILS